MYYVSTYIFMFSNKNKSFSINRKYSNVSYIIYVCIYVPMQNLDRLKHCENRCDELNVCLIIKIYTI